MSRTTESKKYLLELLFFLFLFFIVSTRSLFRLCIIKCINEVSRNWYVGVGVDRNKCVFNTISRLRRYHIIHNGSEWGGWTVFGDIQSHSNWLTYSLQSKTIQMLLNSYPRVRLDNVSGCFVTWPTVLSQWNDYHEESWLGAVGPKPIGPGKGFFGLVVKAERICFCLENVKFLMISDKDWTIHNMRCVCCVWRVNERVVWDVVRALGRQCIARFRRNVHCSCLGTAFDGRRRDAFPALFVSREVFIGHVTLRPILRDVVTLQGDR